MKKFLSGLLLTALAACSVFAKNNFVKLEKNCVYFIYKVEIRKDLNRDFYSKAILCPELADEPHRSGDFELKKAKAVFKGFDSDFEYYRGVPAGEFTYCTVLKDGKGTADFKGFRLNLFGTVYSVILPVKNNKDSVFKFDEKAKYVYGGTYVYDFVDGGYIPTLVKVIDEYDAAKEWVNEMAGKEVELCRSTVQ